MNKCLMPYISHRRISTRKEREKDQNTRRNNKWGKYYNDKRWKMLRQWQIINFPICYDCMFNGISRPATEVHHVIPFSEGKTMEEKYNLLLDPNNLVSLCSECHDKRHFILNHSN